MKKLLVIIVMTATAVMANPKGVGFENYATCVYKDYQPTDSEYIKCLVGDNTCDEAWGYAEYLYDGDATQAFAGYDGVYSCTRDNSNDPLAYSYCWRITEDDLVMPFINQGYLDKGYTWYCTPT